MVRARNVLLIGIALFMLSSAALAGNINLILGQRDYSDIDEPLDKPTVFAANLDIFAEWPVGLEFGFAYTGDSQTFGSDTGFPTEIELTTLEFSFGIDKVFGSNVTRPFIGAGISALNVDVGFGSETTFGGYVHAGVFWQFAGQFNLGFDLRYLGGTDISDLTTDGSDANVDYFHYGLLIGWGW